MEVEVGMETEVGVVDTIALRPIVERLCKAGWKMGVGMGAEVEVDIEMRWRWETQPRYDTSLNIYANGDWRMGMEVEVDMKAK